MALLQSWLDHRRQKKLDRHKVYSPDLDWTIQLPVHFTMKDLVSAQRSYDLSARMMGTPAHNSIYKDGNISPVFSCHYDKFNMFSGAIAKVTGFSEDQIFLSREDCKDRLFSMFSRNRTTTTERTSSTTLVGGMEFQKHTFLIRRGQRPIFCFEYICQIVGAYELSFSILYNNESRREEMFKSLASSTFTKTPGTTSSSPTTTSTSRNIQ